MNDENNMLRKVRLAPYTDQTRAFILTTYDTGRIDSLGKSIVAYTFEKEGETDPIFSEDSLCVSPMHAIDSDECLRSALTFITLRPGDTDPDYFEKYTERQRAFCSDDAETLSIYSQDDNDPFDEDLLADEDQDEEEETADEDQDDETSEPEEGDITTEDHKRFYQYGKLWLELDQDLASNEMNASIRAQMDKDQFWPNVWFISDHGNAHPMSVQAEIGEKVIASYEIVDHGVDSEQYFQGCGVSFTEYDHVSTGMGDTVREALDDALDQLAMSGYTLGPELNAEVKTADDESLIFPHCPKCGNGAQSIDDPSIPDLDDPDLEGWTDEGRDHACSSCRYSFASDQDGSSESHVYVSVRVKTAQRTADATS